MRVVWICSRIRRGLLASGYLSDIFNGQCTTCQVSLRNRVSGREFSGRVVSPWRTEAGANVDSAAAAARRRVLRVRVSPFFIISASQSGEPSAETFNPSRAPPSSSSTCPSIHFVAFQYARPPHRDVSSRLSRGRKENSPEITLDAFLFTPALLNARIKVITRERNRGHVAPWMDGGGAAGSGRLLPDVPGVARNFLPQSA